MGAISASSMLALFMDRFLLQNNQNGCMRFDLKTWLTENFCIAWLQHKMEELNDQLKEKKNQISNMMERTSEVRRMKEDLKQNLHMVW